MFTFLASAPESNPLESNLLSCHDIGPVFQVTVERVKIEMLTSVDFCYSTFLAATTDSNLFLTAMRVALLDAR